MRQYQLEGELVLLVVLLFVVNVLEVPWSQQVKRFLWLWHGDFTIIVKMHGNNKMRVPFRFSNRVILTMGIRISAIGLIRFSNRVILPMGIRINPTGHLSRLIVRKFYPLPRLVVVCRVV